MLVLNLLRCLIFPVAACGINLPFSVNHRDLHVGISRDKPAELPDLYEASILELQSGLDGGLFTSVDLVKAYIARIEEVNLQGPKLRAVLEINSAALAQAASLDEERAQSKKRSDLHGIPIFLKDNIATDASEGLNTTAGSYSLLGSVVPEDATVVKKLRAAGGIILGKTAMSEWAHFRGGPLPSGWSGRSGQNTNAYYPNADPCGSSSGSGVAASIGLVAVTLGTETDGSITCPSSNNNIVGIKPSVGLTSRTGVIPISSHQDTIGPMARSTGDAAIVLNVIAGPDSSDNATSSQPSPLPDYTRALRKDSLRGKRIGVPRHVFLNDTVTGNDPSVNIAFNNALKTIRELGATVVDPSDLPTAEQVIEIGFYNETFVLEVDFKIELNAYLTGLVNTPTGVRSLADVIQFNNEHPDLELPENYTSQNILIESEATEGRNSTFWEALAINQAVGGRDGIDAALLNHNLDALVLPAPGWATTPAALAGYPIVTVPLGFYPPNVPIGEAGPTTVYPAPGVPFGLSFLGSKWSEFELIGFAYAYEQKTKTRLERRAYKEAIPKTQLKDIIGRG